MADGATRTGRAPVLVLGVGSELRSDDAAGRHVAAAVSAAGPPDIEVAVVHQLAPEHAADVAGRDLVVVVDASVDVVGVTVSEVEPRPGVGAMSHHLDVSALLGLAELVGTPPRRAMTVAVPVRTLALGTELHPATAFDVEVATERVLALVTDDRTSAP